MANLSDSISKFFVPISMKHAKFRPHRRNIAYKAQAASSNKDVLPPQHLKKNPSKSPRMSRRLISILTSTGRWQGQRSCDYVFSLREHRLSDLAEDGQKDADVFVSLTIQKHAGFGFSVDGRIITSFSRKCSCCFSSYRRGTRTITIGGATRSYEDLLRDLEDDDPLDDA